MQKLHQKLIQKYQTYNTWHQAKHHNKIHWGVFVVFTLLIFGTISRWTPISLAADTVAPATPTNLAAAAISSTQINLSWTGSTDDVGVTGYKIYRCAGLACAPTVQIATSAANLYSDTGLTASTAYIYAVSAYDAAGNESGKSGTAPPPAGSYYVASDGSDTNSGGVNSPFRTIAKALSLAGPGETIYLRAGTYSELISFPTAGTSDTGRITLKAYNQEAVTITQTGRVMNIGQPYISVEDIIFDANWGDDDALKIYSTANFAILRGLEVRNTRRDAIDMASPQGVLIENSKIHDAIWVDGPTRYDAHGIVTSGVKDLTIRGVEIYYVSGDAIQFQYGGWNNILIENSTLWNGPLPTARGGAPAGVYLGENAVDTKYYLADGRGRLTIKNVTAYGWKSDYLVNAAAFNLKHNVEVTLDGITTYDNDIAFRLRGPTTIYGGAWVTLKNALIYDSSRGVRYEDKIENLHIYHATWGKGITTLFENAGGYGAGFEARNNLFLSAVKPVEAGDPSNFAAVESEFKNAATYDYHLNPAASMIDKGTTLPEVTTDRQGLTRPQGVGVDPGAYEYQGVAPPPPAWLDPNSPLALNLHPRLLFIPKSYRDANPNAVGITVQEMRNKLISHAEYITEFQTFINTMDSIYNIAPSSKTKMEATYDAVNFSFLYKIDPAVMSALPYNFSFQHTRDEYGNKAIEHAEYIANQAKSIISFSKASWNDYKTFNYGGGDRAGDGITSVSLAIVNDWLNDRITQSTQKLIIDAFINIHGLRWNLNLFASAHHFGVAQNGAGVIGIYGDDLGSQYYKDQMDVLMDDVGNDWIKSFKEMSDLLFGGGSNNPEGPSYDDTAFKNMLSFVNIFATSINENLFNIVSYLREHVFYDLFRIIPMKFDENYIELETDDSGGGGYVTMDWGKNNIYFSSMINGLSREKASLARWTKEKFYTVEDSFDVRYYSVFYRFFQGYKSVSPKSPSMIGLATSKNIGMGQYMMRTGFENQSDSLVAFFAPKYHILDGGHAHRDFASFRIFKYGNLAITRQIAKGFSGGNIMITQHNMFYNTIGVLKPGEMTKSYNVMGYRNGYDDGNAKYVTDPAFMENGASHVGTVLAEDLESVNYDYVNYDYSNSWDKTKVDYAQREFVYLRSQGGTNDEYAVVFDRVNSVSPSYTKYFLLHSSFEPETDGTFAEVRPGKWVSTNSSTVKITNTWNGSHGRLFSKTLLPVNYKINKVGGPGYYWQDADGKVIYGDNLTEEEKNFRGTFTTQVQADTNQNYDNFLHVLQFGDSNTLTAMNNASRIDGDTMVGILIDDPTTPRVIMFTKNQAGATVSTASYTANYSSALTGKHLLAGITPGTYDIYKNGAKILTGLVAQPGKNTLSFESTGGSTFSIAKTGEAPPPADATSPTTPTNLTAAAVSLSQINLSWTASTDDTGVTGYKIYRCAGSACAPTTQIATSAINSYSNTGLTASTAYTYAVSAYDAAGNESGKSTAVSATTLSQFKQADFNKDGIVNQLDFDILKQDWSRTDKPVSDLNQDGIVDSRDLGIMMSSWEN